MKQLTFAVGPIANVAGSAPDGRLAVISKRCAHCQRRSQPCQGRPRHWVTVRHLDRDGQPFVAYTCSRCLEESNP